MLERLRLWGRVTTDPRITGRAGELGHAVFWIDPADDNITLLVNHGAGDLDWHATASLDAGTLADGVYGDVTVSGLGTVFTLGPDSVEQSNVGGDLGDFVDTHMLMFPKIVSQTTLRDRLLDAIDSNGNMGTVSLPDGEVELTGPLVDTNGRPIFHQIYGGGLRGWGQRRSTIRVVAGMPLDTPLITINRCQRLVFEQFRVIQDVPVLETFRIQNDPTADNTGNVVANLTSSLNAFKHITMLGQGLCGTPVRLYLVDPFNGHDDKNDHIYFEDIQSTGYRWCGFVLEGRNAKAIILREVWVSGTYGGGQILNYGISTLANYCPTTMQADGTILAADIGDPDIFGGLPVFGHGASFSVDGRQVSGVAQRLGAGTVAAPGTLPYETGWNFLVGDRNEGPIIRNLYGEKDMRLFYVPPFPAGTSGGAGACTWRLENVKYVVNATYPAPLNVIVEAHNGAGVIENCEHGQRTPGEQVAYDLQQSTGGASAYAFRGNDVSNDDDGNVFVGDAPANPDYTTTNRGYRDGTLARLGVGIVVPTDGPASWPYPVASAQWALIDGGTGPAPDAQYVTTGPNVGAWAALTAVEATVDIVLNGGNAYLCITDGITDTSGGPTTTATDITDGSAHWKYLGAATGVVRDVVDDEHALATGTLEYQQAVTGFTDQKGVHFAQAGGECLSTNSTFANPVTDAIARPFDGWITTVSATRTLVTFGNGGSGQLALQIDTSGLLSLFVAGSTRATGAVDHRGQAVRFVPFYDKAANVFGVYTSLEVITCDTTGLTITNNASHTVMGTNTGQTADWVGWAGATFIGQAKITALRTAAWRSGFKTL